MGLEVLLLSVLQGCRHLGPCQSNGVFARGLGLSLVPRRHLSRELL